MNRKERAAAIRHAIFMSGAKLVSASGYAQASIAKIAEGANVAMGTFYIYFPSQQDFFDQLLLYVGEETLGYFRERISGVATVEELETKGFRAFVDYMKENPGFLRLLDEAEVYAPEAFRIHMDARAKAYMESLKRTPGIGGAKGFDDDELEVVVNILLSARSRLYTAFQPEDGGEFPEHVIQAYVRFALNGLRGGL